MCPRPTGERRNARKWRTYRMARASDHTFGRVAAVWTAMVRVVVMSGFGEVELIRQNYRVMACGRVSHCGAGMQKRGNDGPKLPRS